MIILGTNSIKAAGGFNVANSCRFDKGSSDRLLRTFGTPTSSQKWTLSFWIKRAGLGSNNFLFNTDGGNEEDRIHFNSSDAFIWFEQNSSGGTVAHLETTRKFRDISAWYHIVVARDSTQGTSSNRIKLYVNGVQETALDANTYPSQNDSSRFNTAVSHEIGARNNGTFIDAYLAEIVFIDGSQLAADQFGEFDSDSGIWKPIDVSGLTFGNNGFYLDFEDSSALGNDANGSNNFTVNNLTAIDQTVDTCTNNFATINPLDNYFAQATLTEGNTKVSTQASAEAMSTSTFAMTKGKWYFEVDNISGAGAQICGITPTPSFQTSSHGKSGDVTPHTISYVQSGKVQEGNGSGGQTELASYANYDNGNIIGVYMDLDNLKAYFSKDGSLQSATGIDMDALASNGTGHYMFFVGDYNSGARVCEANFGNGFQSLTSAVSDDNGYGAFEYSPNITGDGVAKKFYSCCTKNLAEYG